MSITASKEDRELGVVWKDPKQDGKPATHVLIVGVGQFAARRLQALRSTPAAARALTSWFLDGARQATANGFRNPDRPLGSLALLLSEADDGSLSTVEGSTVPRATFNAVNAALRAWINRARAHEGSVAVLAIFSHGQAERRRTAVLFEDYGSDDLNPHAGMTEAEQLVDALSTLGPRDKLVIFDCCRTTVDLNLPHQGTFGTHLIGGQPGAAFRRPQVMMSTQYDGAGFGGQDGRPTLFASALLEGLRGCAADVDDLTINTRRLGEITERILGLWREENEPIQVPDTQLGQSFAVTTVPNIDQTTLFITVDEPHRLETTRIQIFEDARILSDTTGTTGPDPFLRFNLPADRTHRIVATDERGQLIGELARRSRPPVGFRKLPDDTADPVVRTEQNRGFAGDSSPVVKFGSRGRLLGSELITLNRSRRMGVSTNDGRDEVLISPSQPDQGDQVSENLSPGDWVVSVSRPGQPRVTRSVRVTQGDTVRIEVPNQRSPHEWLENAVAAGVISLSDRRPADPAGAPKALKKTLGDQKIKLSSLNATSRYALFEAKDDVPKRFTRPKVYEVGNPVWIDFEGEEANGRRWRERGFVPLVGFETLFIDPDPWKVEVLVDSDPPPRGSHVAAYPVSKRWGPLIAYLGRRDFEDAGAMLRKLGPDAVVEAVFGKRDNPLAAICGALVAVATHQVESLRIPEQWLENLCVWFPSLPDGAVILARHRLQTGREVGDLLDEALRRGVPVTSLAVDWLSECLAIAAHPQAAAARDTAMACDPLKAFTVLQLANEVP